MIRLLLLLFAAFSLIKVTGCAESETAEQANRSANRAPTVEAVQVITGNLPLEEILTGTVRARNQADIFPQISAPITRVAANNGDIVQKGDILVQLRDVEARERLRQAEAGHEIARAQVRQAEADLNRRRLELERVRSLHSRDLETQAELENIQADVDLAEASLDLNKARMNQAHSIIEERKNELENTVVRAPVDGIVGLRNAETGQQANPSTRLYQIGDPASMKVEIILTEAMTGYIRPGQPVLISTSSIDNSVESTITRISPFLNPVTHTTTAEIEVSNPDRLLRPGMFVTVTVKYGESEKAVLVPNNALFHHPDQGQQGIFVADRVSQELSFEGEQPPRELTGTTPVRFVPVDVIAQGRMISAVNGIPNNAWVVTLGQHLLLRGAEEASIRPVEWDHIINLQQLHSRDLFDIIREKMASQQKDQIPNV